MPVFNYQCAACGERRDAVVWRPDETVPCGCGQSSMERLFSPTTALRLAPWLRGTENDDARARQRAYIGRPEVQAKLRTGQYEIDTSDRYCDSRDGDAASSSVQARAEAGLLLR